MKGLKTLTLMQLKDKLDLSCFASVKKTIFKVVLSILKFAVITAIIYFAFYILNYLRIVSILPGIPQNFFSLIFIIMILLSIFVCTFGLTNNLYFAKDNQFLLTMPANKIKVFTSKLLVYFIYEFLRNIYFMLPLFIAYGFINTLPFYYYIWILIPLILVTAFCVALGALLSIPAMLITVFLKKNKWLEICSLTIFLALCIFGVILLINAIPENFDLLGSWGTTFWKVQNFIESFNNIFLPLSWLAISVVGERYGISNILFSKNQFLALLFVLVFIIIVISLSYLIVKPLYLKMSSYPFEYNRKKVTKKIHNKKLSTYMTLFKKDVLLNYRVSEKFVSLLFIIIAMPLAIFLLNKLYSAMDTRLSGAFMVVAFNLLIILLFTLSSNTAFSHIYSEEGNSAYLMKTSPKPFVTLLFSKLLVNIISMSASLLLTCFIFTSFVDYNIWTTILIFLICECVYLSHLFWSAELDVMNPQNAQYQITGTHINNPNEVKSSLLVFILSALFAFLTYFYISENESLVWYKILFFAALFLAFRIWSYVNKIKVYFKEK